VSKDEVIRELMLTIEALRYACEHSCGWKAHDIERLGRAASLATRVNAKHATQLTDYQLESFWSDVKGLPKQFDL
jgi:hypothetical protein